MTNLKDVEIFEGAKPNSVQAQTPKSIDQSQSSQNGINRKTKAQRNQEKEEAKSSEASYRAGTENQ